MRRTIALAAALALAGCHDDDGSGATAFEPFVTGLIRDATDESGEPAALEGRTFVFPDDEDAFSDLLPPDGGAVVE